MQQRIQRQASVKIVDMDADYELVPKGDQPNTYEMVPKKKKDQIQMNGETKPKENKWVADKGLMKINEHPDKKVE